MRTSCRFAMAIHVLALIAYHEGDPVTSACLAKSINTNPVIVRRLLLQLQRAKLIETGKGVGSGSRLTCAAKRITLAQIYRAVESCEPFTTPARRPNPACPIGHSIHRTLDQQFASAQAALERHLEQTTLADLLAEIRRVA